MGVDGRCHRGRIIQGGRAQLHLIRRSETALAPLRGRERSDLLDFEGRRREYEQLGDARARLNGEARIQIGVVQRHAYLAAVARVDQARPVQDRDAVTRGKARAGHDERAPARRKLDRDPASHRRPSAGIDLRSLGGDEVEAGIVVIGPARQGGTVAQRRDAHDPRAHPRPPASSGVRGTRKRA